MTTTVEEQITDNFNAVFNKLKSGFLKELNQLIKTDSVLEKVFHDIFDPKINTIELPEDFCFRLKENAHKFQVEDTTKVFLQLRSLVSKEVSQCSTQYEKLFTWMYWTSDVFFFLVDRPEEQQLTSNKIKNIQTTSAMLTKCKLEYNACFLKIQQNNERLFEQLYGLYSPFSSYKPINPGFFEKLQTIGPQICAPELSKVSRLLYLPSVPFVSDKEWEIISRCFSHISGFSSLVSEPYKLER